MMKHRRPALKRAKAQAMVETALMLPILLLLLVGIVDLGRIFYYEIALANAAREGARVGTNSGATNATVQAAVIAAARPVEITAANTVISPASSRSASSGQTVTVTVSFALPMVTPGMSAVFAPFLTDGKFSVVQSAAMVVI
jgi:Flp pilus assembly protein TadG